MPKRKVVKRADSDSGPSASRQIDAMIEEVPGWRADALSRFRSIIRQACPDVLEEIKWRKPSNPDGVPVWSHQGILCVANVWKDHVRLSFANGGQLKDPKKVFNAALNGNYLRGLDLREGDTFDEKALTALVRAAMVYNEKAVAQRAQASSRRS